MKTLRRLIAAAAAMTIVIAGAAAFAKHLADPHYFDGYDPKPPLDPRITETVDLRDTIELWSVQRRRDFQRVMFDFESEGCRVPAALALPHEVSGRLPAVVFLHGRGHNKSFINKIATPFVEAGFALATFDQLGKGDREAANMLEEGLVFYRRPRQTVHDARRLIDYLQTRPDIDPGRIYLVGVSYGAMTGCTVTAQDKRVRAAVLIVGGGNLGVVLKGPAVRMRVSPSLYHVAKPLALWLMDAADPIHYAAGTNGTPLLFLNGELDQVITPEAGQCLFAAAGEPKQIRWYPVDHPGRRHEDTPAIIKMIDDGIDWLKSQDAAVLSKKE